jgi:hypothetical protein
VTTDNREYRGYFLTAIHHASEWQVAIYPDSPRLRDLPPEEHIVHDADKEDAFAEAERRVDAVLASVS